MGHHEHSNICILGIPEGEENEQGTENLVEETMTKHFPDLMKEQDTQVQEAKRAPNKWTQRGLHQARHIIFKIAKLKDKQSPKSCKRKAGVTYKGAQIRQK